MENNDLLISILSSLWDRPFYQLTNSSLQPWWNFMMTFFLEGRLELNYDPQQCELWRAAGDSIGLRISSGWKEDTLFNNSCQAVCIQSIAAVDPAVSINLLNCGLWAVLATRWQLAPSELINGVPVPPQPVSYPEPYEYILRSDFEPLLAKFALLGLDAANTSQLIRTRNAVSFSLNALIPAYVPKKADVNLPWLSPCSEELLFSGFDVFSQGDAGTLRLMRCLNAICTSKTLDPDLGGIGVYVSLIFQLTTAMTACFALIGLSTWRTWKRQGSRLQHYPQQSANLITALTEFHKHQCYFLSAIEIAVIYMCKTFHIGNQQIDSFTIAVPLALNGCVPQVFVLLFVTVYGQLTWFIIGLTAANLSLSTWALAESRSVWRYGADSHNMDADRVMIPQYELRKSICGSQGAHLNVLQRDFAKDGFIWSIYVYCVILFLMCVLKHLLQNPLPLAMNRRISSTKWSIKFLDMIQGRLQGRTSRAILATVGSMLLAIWLLIFAYLFYLYAYLKGNRFISTEWNFGQIVAIGVWIPSIMEFLYIERVGITNASANRYPPGWQVINTLVRNPPDIANLEVLPDSSIKQKISHPSNSDQVNAEKDRVSSIEHAVESIEEQTISISTP